MATNLQAFNYMQHFGMDTRTSKVILPDDKLLLAQNVHYREAGALTKRNGYTQVNNSQVQN